MRIIELNINQFGKLCDRSFSFSDGFNIIEGKNESGKSTLQAFIKFMLYGLPRRNPNVLIGERERALSWIGNSAAGNMTVSVGSKTYRIERNGSLGARGAYVEKEYLIDLETGLKVDVKGSIGEMLLGLDAAAYDSMCNVRQLECTSVDGGAVKGAIENLLSSGDESTSVEAATKALDKERVKLLHKNAKGGLIFETEQTIFDLEDEIVNTRSLETDSKALNEDLERTERQLAKSKRDYEISSRKCDLFEDVKRLEKFRTLSELKAEGEELRARLETLERENGVKGITFGYEDVANMRSSADILAKSKETLDSARAERRAAEEALGNTRELDSAELEDLLSEFGSPRNLINNLYAKKKKAMGATVLAVIALVAAAALFGGACFLAFVKSIPAGAITVAFGGALLLAVGSAFLSTANKTKKALLAIISRVGSSMTARDTEKIAVLLEDFAKESEKRRSCLAAHESAGLKLAMAEENYSRIFAAASSLLSRFAIEAEEGKESEALASLAERLRSYLSAREELLGACKENDVLVNSLKKELERYSEKALGEKITPDIEAAIKNASFDKLKLERDAALYKINELNRYKAELERRCGGLEVERRSINAIIEEIAAHRTRLDSYKIRYDAITLASETIAAASQRLKSSLVPSIRSATEANMATITDGKYSQLFVDDNMSLSVLADGETRPIESLSKGSCDAAYLSVRLALLETLCAEQRPPVFMDESLSQLDDDRATNTLRAIADYCKTDSQGFLFTCQTRDAILARSVTDVNVIEL